MSWGLLYVVVTALNAAVFQRGSHYVTLVDLELPVQARLTQLYGDPLASASQVVVQYLACPDMNIFLEEKYID